jgi:hypothetical protein
MKKVFLAFMLPALTLLIASCSKDRVTGSGSVTTETRSVNNFTGVATSGSTDITVLKGDNFKVEVRGYNNLLPYLETVVENNVLKVRFKDNTNIRHDNTEVTVTMPALNFLSIAGSANILSTGEFISNGELSTRISGSGDITLEKGSAKTFRAEISGSGNIQAFGMSVENAQVKIAGSGNTRVSASGNLNVEIAGSGNVYYKGSPTITASVSGSGRVEKQ